MVRLYRDVHQAMPDALFDDQFLSPSAALVVEPLPTLAALADQAREDGWPLDLSIQAMAAVPADNPRNPDPLPARPPRTRTLPSRDLARLR